ncbi:MAG: hypothetical protein M1470_00895, partial [Bacteroidetes bacterium]|nr:hypothetical protein [Bacteroidota bacterium]
MRQLIRSFISGGIVLLAVANSVFGQWTAQAYVKDLYYRSHAEFRDSAYVVVYLNGVQQQPLISWYYKWQLSNSLSGPWNDMTGGFGYGPAYARINPDANIGSQYYYRVYVTGPGFAVLSNSVGAYMPGPSQQVNFYAQENNGTSLSSVTISHFTNPDWMWGVEGQSAPSFFLQQGTGDSPEAMRIVPNFLSDINYGFNNWSGNDGTALYQDYFTLNNISSGLTQIISYYNPADGNETIATSVVDAGGANGGTVQIKDPWLVDTSDPQFYTPPYGYHNLGMNAPFKSEPSPLQLTTSSKYNGVFLNQNPDPNNPQKPYYSASAPLIQNINGYTAFFAGWTSSPANSASFQNASATTTPVVFNSSGATVIAQ